MGDLESLNWYQWGRLGWTRVGTHSYRHYCGARITKRGKLWIAKTVAGVSIAGHTTEFQAVACLVENDPSFWTYGEEGWRDSYNGVHFLNGSLNNSDNDIFLVCYLSDEKNFSILVKPVFKKNFFGKATCVKCLRPMIELRFRTLRHFYGNRSTQNAYLTCDCGYPVWRLDRHLKFKAETAMRRSINPPFRRQMIKDAEGTHSPKEIEEILAIQENCCIYCNVNFTKEVRPTKDHLLPISMCGSNWSSNIVMACKPCNLRRSDIPFRTYCRLLSRTQNQRILMHLSRRLLALDEDDEAQVDFLVGLAYHNSRHRRYRGIQRTSAIARRNAATNQLLPQTASLILKKYGDMQIAMQNSKIAKLQNELRELENKIRELAQ